MAAQNPQESTPDFMTRLANEHPLLALLVLILLAAVASVLLLYQQDATIVLYENF